MSDQFDQLFTRARPTAVSAIRPPGAEAARRTVRLRKRRRTVTITAAVVLAALGGFLARPGTPPEPVVAIDLAARAGSALGDATGPVALEKQGEVRDGWAVSGASYFGEQHLTVACAGTGTMTLRITGTPVSENPSRDPVDVTLVDVPCSAWPTPAERRYLTGEGLDGVEYTVINASGTGAFAFRVQTPDTGEPLSTGDGRANPTNALQLTEKENSSGFGMSGALEEEATAELPDTVGGRFAVAVACAGVGRLDVSVRRVSGGVVDTWRAPCGWPPRRYDWEPARGSGELELQVVFVRGSESVADADFAVQVIPR